MYLTNIIRFVALVLVSGQIRIHAEEPAVPNGETNLPPMFKTQVKGEEIIGDRQIHHAYLTLGTNQFSFIVPDNFHVDSSSPDRLAVVNQGYDCFMTVRLVEPVSGEAGEPNLETCRGLLLSRHPGAQISEEYARSIANHSGPAFDFQWQNAGATIQAGRVIYVRTGAGILEFSLLTAKEKFTAGEYAFSTLLLTFRTNEKGKLEVVHLDEKA